MEFFCLILVSGTNFGTPRGVFKDARSVFESTRTVFLRRLQPVWKVPASFLEVFAVCFRQYPQRIWRVSAACFDGTHSVSERYLEHF